MKQFGIFLAIMGVGSFVLNLIGMEFRLLMWIDLWGTAIGTAIRIGLVILGALLFVIGMKMEGTESNTNSGES